MKKRNVLLVAAALAIASAGGLAYASSPNIFQGPSLGVGGCPPGQARKGNCVTKVKAPEIDATAGVQAIALLSGILLLVGERARRRQV